MEAKLCELILQWSALKAQRQHEDSERLDSADGENSPEDAEFGMAWF